MVFCSLISNLNKAMQEKVTYCKKRFEDGVSSVKISERRSEAVRGKPRRASKPHNR